jgi:hypothetical protein
MNNSALPGHGALQRPDHLKIKDRRVAGAPAFDWSRVKEDAIGNVPNLFGIKDRDQGSSLSCTCHSAGYGFAYATGIEISRRDMYSQVALPGGGAYLNAPLDWLRKSGYLLQSKFPDPSAQTEKNMTDIIAVKDGDRIRFFELMYTFYPDASNIDSAAAAAANHDYIHLGIMASWKKGWDRSWVDPVWQGINDWQHALFACKDSIVLRHGVPAIKAKSSWCEHRDYTGQPVYCHYLTKNYFAGVFEIIGVDIKEIHMNATKIVLSKDGKTVYKAIPVATDFENFKRQADVEGIVIPDPIPPASSL